MRLDPIVIIFRSVRPIATKLKILSFAPVSRPDARILILGSMPGAASLQAGQYYAHPRNAFWPIMRCVLGLNADATYEESLEALRSHRIALWDVLYSCRRKGSLDSAIEPDSVAANDFEAFFSKHPRVAQVCFNGATAERCYRQAVLPGLKHLPLHYVRLPSTSPAHAALSLTAKASIWRLAMKSG